MSFKYNPRHYDKKFQNSAYNWWCSLSINEMKSLENKYNTIYGAAMPSEIAAIYEIESQNEIVETLIFS